MAHRQRKKLRQQVHLNRRALQRATAREHRVMARNLPGKAASDEAQRDGSRAEYVRWSVILLQGMPEATTALRGWQWVRRVMAANIPAWKISEKLSGVNGLQPETIMATALHDTMKCRTYRKAAGKRGA